MGTPEGTVQEVLENSSRRQLLSAAASVAVMGFTAAEARSAFDRALAMQSYGALRAYTGRAEEVRITSAGFAGSFERDVGDTTSPDNGGTVVVDASARRWKRVDAAGAAKPQWWGAVPDGTTNSTAALQAMFDARPAAVDFGSGTYACTRVRVRNGTKSILHTGAGLKALAPSTGEALVEFDGPYFNGTGVDGCILKGMVLDLNGVHRRGVFMPGAVGCIVDSNIIRNFATNTTDKAGIRMHQTGTGNIVVGNVIDLPVDSPFGTYPSAVGVHVVGAFADSQGGFGTGAFIPPTSTCDRNQITGNKISGGTHGISLSAATFNLVGHNICRGQSHRSVILSPQATDNEVVGNQCLEFGSSGIHLAYASLRNQISGNNLKSLTGGEGGIQCYVGSSDNNVLDNRIECAANYGVYVAVESKNNVVRSNYIVGTFLKKAGIAIENDWARPVPAGATYSRPNYGPPPKPRTTWGIADTSGNVVDNNTILSSSTICAIYLGQVGLASKNTGNTVKNNHVLGLSGMTFMFYEQTPGSLEKIIFSGNTSTKGSRNGVSMTRGRLHFSTVAGNTDTLDFPDFVEPVVKN